MIYDRFGQFTFRETDERRRVAAQRVAAAEPCPEPVPREDTHGPPSPVPHTRVRLENGRVRVTGADSDELVLTPEALRYYAQSYQARRKVREEVLADEGECDFELGHVLRLTWVTHQRGDSSLMTIIGTEPIPNGYRVAPDGLLEKLVPLPPPAGDAWVPVVPDGKATGNLSWKRWLFLQFHVGMLGAHRSAAKTYLQT